MKSTVILSIGTFLPKITTFITLPILTGCLTQEEYGTYDLITTVLVALLLPAVTLQIQTAAFRFLIDAHGDQRRIKEIISNIVAFVIPVSVFSLIVLYFCLIQLLPEIRLLICIYFLVDIFHNTALQIIRGVSDNISYSVSALINAFGMMLFLIVFVYVLQLGLEGAVIALTLSCLLALIFLIIKGKLFQYIDVKILSRNTLKELLAYSWPMVPNSMSMWVMRVSDRIVVTAFMGVVANATYSVANKIPSILTLAQNTFSMAWQENASIYSKDKDIEKYYSYMFRTLFDFMAGFMGLLIATTPFLFIILIHGDYQDAYIQIPILFLGMFFFSLCSFLGGIYVAFKETKKVGVTTTVAAVCNLIIDLALIKYIGLFAASGSTLVSYILLFVYRLIDIKKIVRIKFSWSYIIFVSFVLAIEGWVCSLNIIALNFVNFILSLAMFVLLNYNIIKSFLGKIFNK